MKTSIKVASTKTNSITLKELCERIEDFARERSHWDSPIKRSENIFNLNINNKNNSNFQNKYNNNYPNSKYPNSKFPNNQNSQYYNSKSNNQNSQYHNSKPNSNKNKNYQKTVRCSLCQGNHNWFKCPLKDEIGEYGKKLRERKSYNSANTVEQINAPTNTSQEDIFVLNTINNSINKNSIILDSGCSTIISNNKDHFINIKKVQNISLKNFLLESPYECNLGGTACFNFKNANNQTITLQFDDVLYVPNARYSLLPPSILYDNFGYKTQIENDHVLLIHQNKPFIKGYRENNIYKIDLINTLKPIYNITDEEQHIESANNLMKLSHYKLGHVATTTIKKWLKIN